jgi:hypothetical protein
MANDGLITLNGRCVRAVLLVSAHSKYVEGRLHLV